MGRGRDDVTVGVDIGPGRATIAAIQDGGVVIWEDWRGPVTSDDVIDALLDWIADLDDGHRYPVVVTHPVGLSRREVRRIRHRLEQEGLRRVGVMPTGEAAARDHARHRIVAGSDESFSVAVLDMGAESGELTILDGDPDGWQIVGAVHQLTDLSARAVRADVRAIVEHHALDLDVSRAILDGATDAALATLVGSTSTSVDITLGDRRVKLRRRTLLAPLFDRISALGREFPDLLGQVGLDEVSLESLVLCGELADMPDLAAKLGQLIGCPVKLHAPARQAAARGSALAAAGLGRGVPRWARATAAAALVVFTLGGMLGLSRLGIQGWSDQAVAGTQDPTEESAQAETGVLGESVSRATAVLGQPQVSMVRPSSTAGSPDPAVETTPTPTGSSAAAAPPILSPTVPPTVTATTLPILISTTTTTTEAPITTTTEAPITTTTEAPITTTTEAPITTTTEAPITTTTRAPTTRAPTTRAPTTRAPT
ncbi:MAG: hypothetical protein GY713_06155, partial [Actinomycetia bacterium]|nr:hypothetical protein [Actinomycetes bacterium]